jgi:hypothetical protein
MFASASALRSARDTGFVSMPCPSAVGASSPIERSAFIVAIMCVPLRVDGVMWLDALKVELYDSP